jgi:4-amino-4-deoxy-L-arabinose transferase-like glycosyltransferase
LLWAGVVFVFFSIPRSKLGGYILPALPPLAILAGYSLGGSAKDSETESVGVANPGFFAIANLTAAVAVTVAALIMLRTSGMMALALDGIFFVWILTIGAGASFFWSTEGDRGRLAPTLIAALAALVFVFKGAADADRFSSYRGLADDIAKAMPADCTLASYRHFVQSLPFYTDHREVLVDYVGELAPGSQGPEARASFADSDAALDRIWRSRPCAVLVFNQKDLPALKTIIGTSPCIIGAEGKKLAAINRASAAVQCRNP